MAKPKGEEFEYANEILITKSELEEKNRLVFNLQQQVDETRTESEYQLRLKDNKFAEEFKMAKKQSEAEIGEMSQQITRLQTEMRNTSKIHEGELGNAMEENEKAMVEMAEQYKSKLIVEYQKFDNLEEKHNNLKTTYESKMKAVEKLTKVSSHNYKINKNTRLSHYLEIIYNYICIALLLLNMYSYLA